MKILVAVKRVTDFNVKVRVKPDGSDVDIGSLCGADSIIGLSAKTGAGLDLLKNALLAQIGWRGESEGLFLARSRHLDALARAAVELQHAAVCVNQAELLAEHLRLAQNACNEITGEFTADDLLGVIFSRFCIGK